MTPDSAAGFWHRGPPAAPEAVSALAVAYPGLPTAYLDFLRGEDGSEGDLDVQPYWVQFWPAAEVAEHNEGYEVEMWIPGFLGFASSGGGELLAFDTRAQPWRVCTIPFIPMREEHAIEIAPDFASFTAHLGVRAAPD